MRRMLIRNTTTTVYRKFGTLLDVVWEERTFNAMGMCWIGMSTKCWPVPYSTPLRTNVQYSVKRT